MRLLAVVIGLFVSGVSAASASEMRWATLEAIHKLENPNNLTRPGPHGELGAYQIRPSTWRMHTKTPFYKANSRAESDIVAVRHYEWIKEGLVRNGVSATPYNIALAWNGGLSATINGKAPRAAHDYARRATNLASEYQARARLVAQAN